MTYRLLLAFSTLFLFFISFSACKNNSKEKLLGGICDTSDTKFSTFVNPFITSKCLSCHSTANAGSAGGGTDLEGYNNISDHSSSILSSMIRTNNPMPKNGSTIDACSITKFQSWLNQGTPNN